MPRTLNRVTGFQAGAALAAHVATAAAEAFLKDHELSPRVDPERCRGCGRCVDICPFDAVQPGAQRPRVLTRPRSCATTAWAAAAAWAAAP